MNESLYRFSILFHQDCDLYGSTWEEMIAIVLSIIGKNKAEKLKVYLHGILSSDLSDRDLMDIWENSRSEIGFGDAPNYRNFFEMSYNMAHRFTQE